MWKDFFPNFDEKGLIQYDTKEMRSGIYWNDNQTFRFIPLPIQAQFSPIFGIDVVDYNKDGLKDVIIGGNIYALKPQMGRHNASKGLVLKNTGKQRFDVDLNTGFSLEGEVRGIITVKDKIIVVRNNHRELGIQRREIPMRQPGQTYRGMVLR